MCQGDTVLVDTVSGTLYRGHCIGERYCIRATLFRSEDTVSGTLYRGHCSGDTVAGTLYRGSNLIIPFKRWKNNNTYVF